MIITAGDKLPQLLFCTKEQKMINFFKQVIEIYNDTFRFYKTVYELSNLSEDELHHLGIKRNEIPFIAMKASLTDK